MSYQRLLSIFTSRRIASGCAFISLISATISIAEAGVLKSEVVITTGLSLPIFAAAPAGDFNHLYIAEETVARIKRLDLTTNQLITVLDLPDVVVNNQTGINGFAFHPDHANNGKIYINLSGNAAGDIRILEYTRSIVDPNVFDPATERQILTVSNPTFSHNGGWIGFGPHDDYLYMAMGDGGNVPPQSTKGLPAQDLNSLKGKILRVDVDSDDFPADATRNYAIPSTNPFSAGGGAPEVFAWGLRHPFRSGFDSANGDLYIGDVGSNHYEEINFLPGDSDGGQNFGWRPREGFLDNPDFSDPSPPGAIDPIHAYPRGFQAAVIGGPVYRGDDIPWLQGTYLFGDFSKKQFFSLRYDGNQVTEFVDRTAELASSLGNYGGVTNFAEDAAGELYLIDYIRGDIYRIVGVPPVEWGDYNEDGFVDAADYVVWRKGGPTFTPDDYDIWQTHFGETSGIGGGSASRTTVPEPTSLFLVLVACAMAIVVRCR